MSFSQDYLSEVIEIANKFPIDKIEEIVTALREIKKRKGRVFVIGVGGSAANASHFVNDLRKLCEIEAYAPTDNVAEITARTNDEGWPTVFHKYLRVSNLCSSDAIFIFSVGGGSEVHNISTNIVNAIYYASDVDATIMGIVGKSTGYTAVMGDHVIVVPELFPDRITPHSESYAMVVTHCIVSHPLLKCNPTKW